jgi:hypothetical protein
MGDRGGTDPLRARRKAIHTGAIKDAFGFRFGLSTSAVGEGNSKLGTRNPKQRSARCASFRSVLPQLGNGPTNR